MSDSRALSAACGVRVLGSPSTRRVRPKPGDTEERILLEADERGRDGARQRVESAFCDFDLAVAHATADSGTVALVKVDSTFLRSIDARRLVDRDTLTSDLSVPRLRLADGVLPSPVPEEIGVVDPPSIAGDAHAVRAFATWQVIDEGMTLILNNIASRGTGPLRDFSNDVGRVTATRPQINAYLSERDAPGFGLHWDDHDVLVVQCEGRKYWEVFEPAFLSPMVGYTDSTAFGERVFSAVLEPGMGLYIPRGWGHQVRGFRDELSLHLTCGMRRMSGVDLVRGLVEFSPAAGSAALGPDGSLDAAAFESLGRADAEIEDVYGRWRERSTPMLHVGPLGVWSAEAADFEGWSVYAPAIGGLVFADSPELSADELGFAASKSVFGIQRSWVPLLAALLEGRQLTVADCRQLVPHATEEACHQWIVQLGLAEFTSLYRTQPVPAESGE